MELICPSCEARYQVPDGSIGEKGRQVSCMNCGHSWHAYPPLILGTAGGNATASATPPVQTSGQSAPVDTGIDAGARRQFVEAVSNVENDRPVASHSEQLAEIREILAEVQSEDSIAPIATSDPGVNLDKAVTPDPDERRRPDVPPPPPLSTEPTANLHEVFDDPLETAEATADGADPLRERLERRQREEAPPKKTNVNRLMRRHQRRERRVQRAKKAGSGAFLTGFLFVAILAAVMTALYILKPQIVERLPGADPALTEYVQTIDGIRLSVAESLTFARDWLVERTERFF